MFSIVVELSYQVSHPHRIKNIYFNAYDCIRLTGRQKFREVNFFLEMAAILSFPNTVKKY